MEKIQINKQLALDIITICKAYEEGNRKASKAAWGNRKKQILAQAKDLKMIQEELNKLLPPTS